jgi:hypothetical protein
VQGFKSKLDCKDKVESYYCAALDKFAAGDSPKTTPSFYPGLSIFANLLKEPREVKEEASFLITLDTQAEYDSIKPENEAEKKQVATYLDYFHRGAAPPATDPIVKFSSTLSTTKVVVSRRAGKSLVFERPLKAGDKDPNTTYLREAPDALIAVEVGPAISAGKLFFVGVFPKSLRITPPK